MANPILAHAMVLVKVAILSLLPGLGAVRSEQAAIDFEGKQVKLERGLTFENITSPSASLEDGHVFREGSLDSAGKVPISIEQSPLEKFEILTRMFWKDDDSNYDGELQERIFLGNGSYDGELQERFFLQDTRKRQQIEDFLFREGALDFAAKKPRGKEKALLDKLDEEKKRIERDEKIQDRVFLDQPTNRTEATTAMSDWDQDDPNYDEALQDHVFAPEGLSDPLIDREHLVDRLWQSEEPEWHRELQEATFSGAYSSMMQDLVVSGSVEGAHFYLSRMHAARAGKEIAGLSIPIPFVGTLLTAFDYAASHFLNLDDDIRLAFQLVKYADFEWYKKAYSVSYFAWALESSPFFDPTGWRNMLCKTAGFIWQQVVGASLPSTSWRQVAMQFVKNATKREMKVVPMLKVAVHWYYALWHEMRAEEQKEEQSHVASPPACAEEDVLIESDVFYAFNLNASIKKFGH